MGTFAETAIFDYHLSFADQGKQNSALRFCILLVPFSVYIYVCMCICTYTYVYICMYILHIHIHLYMLLFQTENGKWKPKRFSLIRLMVVCHLSVCWWRNKGKLSTVNELNGLNGVNGLAHLCIQVCALLKLKLTGKIHNSHHLPYIFYCTVKYLAY